MQNPSLLWNKILNTDHLFLFVDPSKRVFYLSLISSYVIAMIFLIWKKKTFWESLKFCFHKNFWWQPSLWLDYKLIGLNSFLKSILTPIRIMALAGISVFVKVTLEITLGESQLQGLYNNSTLWIISIIVFITEDFARFFNHYLQHKIPFLWRFHAVHHSATVMNPFTLYRTHPFEIIQGTVRSVLVLGILGGISMYLFSKQLSTIDIIGVDALGLIFNFAGANLRHSHIPISYGFMEKWFISPAQHQLHHSVKQEHYDTNMGACFAIWDRIFQTWKPAQKEKVSFGVNKLPEQFTYSLRSALFWPITQKEIFKEETS